MEKVAVIEIGRYYAKLNILAVSENNYFVVIDSKQDDFRFNYNLDENDGFFKKPEIDAMINILKNYRKMCEVAGVEKTFAIGNFSNNGKCKNLNSFVDEIFSKCGFKFVVLTNSEQNQYLYTAVINKMDIPKAVVIDVGLDAIHLLQYNRRMVMNETVIHTGAISLLEEYPFKDDEDCAEHIQLLKEKIDEQIADIDWIKDVEEEYVTVCTGDLVIDLADMIRKFNKHPIDTSNNYLCSKQDLDNIVKQIEEIDLTKNKKIRGIKEERADVFAVGAMFIQKLFNLTKKDSLMVSNADIATGVLFNQIIPETIDKPLADVLGFSLVAQTSYYDKENAKHNEQVYSLAMLLFKQLKVIHKLPRSYARILRAGSYLHDAGERVSFDNHSKHSFYVILASEIFGLTHREQVLAAFVASMHEDKDINMIEWVKYKDLFEDEDLDVCKKMGVICRLAEQLDRAKHAYIIDISCDILGDSVILKTVTEVDNRDVAFEIAEGMKVYREFEKNFKKKLEII